MNQSNSVENKGSGSQASTEPRLTGRLAVLQANWHREIVEQATIAFIDELEKNGIARDRVDVFDVAGSLELPLQSKLLAETGKYDIITAAGLIVDGGIYRHEFVAQAVLNGMMQVQLETRVPILSLVLTPHLFDETEVRKDYFFNHFKVKGIEAAQSCLQTLGNLSDSRVRG